MRRPFVVASVFLSLMVTEVRGDGSAPALRLPGAGALALATAVDDFGHAMSTRSMDDASRVFASDLRNYDVAIRSLSQGYEIEFIIRSGASIAPRSAGRKEITLVFGGGRYVIDGTKIVQREFYR